MGAEGPFTNPRRLRRRLCIGESWKTRARSGLTGSLWWDWYACCVQHDQNYATLMPAEIADEILRDVRQPRAARHG